MVEYIYCDKVGAGPEHPSKRWGLYSKELTVGQARARYGLDAVKRSDWFGIVRIDEEGRPTSFLQICPRANGVKLQRISRVGSVDASYIWDAYYDPADTSVPYAGGQESVFLGQICWYSYPSADEYLRVDQCLGLVMMNFREDGYVKEDLITSRPFGEPNEVTTTEYRDVPVEENWLPIPEFGDWEGFFSPERHLGK